MKISKTSKKWLISVFGITILLIVFKQDIIVRPYHYYRSLSATIETVEINISKEELHTIDSLRADVLKHKKVTPAHKSYIKASITYNNVVSKVKLRLKGDLLDHYRPDPPSYRVKVLKDKTVLGTNKFSIQHYGARNFAHEWLFHRMLEQEDILSLHTDIIELNVNGKKSLRTFEEHFTHHIIDRFERTPGPILCISEDLFWRKGANKIEDKIYFSSPIKVFKYYAPLDPTVVTAAKNLLDDFRNNRKTATEAFDIDRLAKHLAISDLTNTHHGVRWHNRRYYYNPSTKKLEPIGFDGSSWDKISAFAFDNPDLKSLEWSNLSSNKEFVRCYLNHLEKFSKKSFIDQFLNKNKNDIAQLENKIYRIKPFFSDKYNFLYINAEWIRDNLDEYKNRLLSSRN